MTDATEIHFDGWTLRPRSGELLRDGHTQRLSQQLLRLLVELLEHPEEVVPRERVGLALGLLIASSIAMKPEVFAGLIR